MANRLNQYMQALPQGISRALPPRPSPRETELILMGAAADAADFFIGMIPVVGDALADIAVDNIEGDMRRRFTPEEQAEFTEQTRFLPSGLATWRAFDRIRQRRAGGR